MTSTLSNGYVWRLTKGQSPPLSCLAIFAVDVAPNLTFSQYVKRAG